ncbi:E4 SUMO-protein ligase PIAL2-like isoform X1 [Zingiber officinale]|uniref:E4 SUMO-protein ligase PIAL2-like isoform X1 n=1 Tax=Zingiber officinale TaxID=94328 RepID=UPI001C4D2BF7|nr:E4 SUMO-protein ligase PIAL2-like isoform X1 [Zingiber officinale]
MVAPQAASSLPHLPRAGMVTQSAHMPQQSAAALAAAFKNQLSNVVTNNYRLRAVAERLQLYFHGGVKLGQFDLFHLIFALSRGIDYALSINDNPGISNCLPSLIKQVYQHLKDPLLKSAIMVLMISVKNACKNRWFLKPDADELLCMSNELSSSFCMSVNDSIIGNPQDAISKIMVRFYPQLKFCHLVVSFTAKPGYDILMTDFHISRNIPVDEKIYLLVAQTDNLESSSSLISPLHVSFLLNGKGVERRTNVAMDTGPQFPTDVTKMLKYGTNIIQAIGYFSSNYIIAIAFMSKMTKTTPKLPDYAHPVIENPVSDLDVIEGPSRITLNCPISFKRIKIPVKGYLCKHHQCFDYDNFIEMNSRKPCWRCPCCNSSTSCIDLRVDQKMIKILQEVGYHVNDILIYADGSWKYVEHNGIENQTQKGSKLQDDSVKNDDSTSTVDLTMEEDYTSDIARTQEVSLQIPEDKAENDFFVAEDRKPLRDNEGLTVSHTPGASVASSYVGTHQTHYAVDGIRPRNLPLFSCFTSDRIDDAVINTQRILENNVTNVMLNPVQTDAVSPAFVRGPTVPELPRYTLSQMIQLSENMQLQSSHVAGAVITNETGRSTIPRHLSGTLTAIQALPSHSQSHNSSRKVQSVMANRLGSVSEEMQIDQPSNISNVPSALLHHHPMTQEHYHHSKSSQLSVVGLPAPSLSTNQAPQGQLQGTKTCNPDPNHIVYHRRHHSANIPEVSQPSAVPAGLVQQASHHPTYSVRTVTATRNVPVSSPHITQAAAQPWTSRNPPISRLTSISTAADTNGVVHSSILNQLPEIQYDESWRPTGRMRGSLTGGAYDAALNQYLVSPQPPQPVPQSSSASVITDQLMMDIDPNEEPSMNQQANIGYSSDSSNHLQK